MCLLFKLTWPNKSYANCRRSSRQWRRRKSSAGPRRTATPIWRLCRGTRSVTGLTDSVVILKRLSNFLREQRNSIRNSPVHLLHWRGSTIGVIRTSTQRLREGKKHVLRQKKRFVCSRTCQRPISQWVFIITIVSVITKERSTSSPSRG